MNFYILEYALASLLNQKYKTIFITSVLALLIFLLSSMLFIKSSIKHELDISLDWLPEITVQNIKAGRHYDIDVDVLDKLLDINGVSGGVARVWGYYYFENAGVNFSLVGIDEYEKGYKKSLEKASLKLDFDNSSMFVGQGVKKVLEQNHYSDYFNFIKPDGEFKKVTIAGVFEHDTNLESNDVLVMSKDDVREIFDIDEHKATDIVLKVPNKDEISTIVSKIKLEFPSFRVISKEDLMASYQNIFDYKSGIFLALFTISIFTFFIIIYDRASGLSSEQKREIGILRAIGWRVEHILKERFYEGFIVSAFSYILGVILSFVFVYMLQAPLLRELFSGYSKLKPEFELMFVFDVEALALLFFLSVPIYIAAIIIPSWQSATKEVDEVIR
ncbi:MAG: FtsX-like permease family protein [Sulfurimonas sp.]|jgi:ABC-type lipoprotein release transport system permease subunit|nr:FtsX-like permease family protein [Sulfurimonadaceae bacterium]